jgi:hypothetical protein
MYFIATIAAGLPHLSQDSEIIWNKYNGPQLFQRRPYKKELKIL